MLALTIGNESSSLNVKGLPALEIPVGKGGYFDGYVTHAKDLRRIFVTRNFEDIYHMAMAIGYEQPNLALGQYKPGQLAVLHLLNSWARVQITERISASKVSVHFVDIGAERVVDISNLFEIPNKLRNKPPLAFPVDLDGAAVPEADAQDLERLRGVKVAVKMDNKSPKGQFLSYEFTVFDRFSHDALPVFKALADEDISLDKGDAATTVITSTKLTTTDLPITSPEPEDKPNYTAIVIASICGALSIAVVIVAVLFLVRMILKRRRDRIAAQEQDEPESTQNENRIKENPSTNTDHTQVSKKEVENIEVPLAIPLPNEAVAIVVSTMGIAASLDDQQKLNQGLVTPVATNQTDSPQQNLQGRKAVSIESTTNINPTPQERIVAGHSEISTISTGSAGGYPLHKSATYMHYNHTPMRPQVLRPREKSRLPPILRNKIYEEPSATSTPKAYRTCSTHRSDLNISGYSEILNVRPILKQFGGRHVFDLGNLDQTSYETAPSSLEDVRTSYL